MKTQQLVAGEQRAVRRAELPSHAMQETDKQFWAQIFKEHADGTCAECNRRKAEKERTQ